MWRCDEITFLLKDPATIQEAFPVCVNATRPKRTFVHVHASIHEDHINFGSTYRVTFGGYLKNCISRGLTLFSYLHGIGMALWLAILIHLAGTELYVGCPICFAEH